ncbi:DUF485 domain-containing protein [Amycolatopsis acidiphila]|uniref:DUF485 domain-containing protein n=1 Tax=Amycolatopsis acidiphila TaxID=715473 RepID=A0A558A599_9PSEU|nr:DUF485 domain-containing protein [Amycolatopsis acidiphila]TVT19426.1 DUF485 domain-containing protein [Amycolatopsis acidiphila]UIJ56764.1 DUF485 domain-containing protein [Amycolatopsis acidiphila]GHG55257.1 hypothetical protein GCM10017788_05670 [Amycolatopsis acidiphila]
MAEKKRPDTELAVRRRIAFFGGLGALALFMAVPVLTAFTPWFDGKVGSVGAGYVAAAFAIVFPLAGAALYTRWANRWEDRS